MYFDNFEKELGKIAADRAEDTKKHNKDVAVVNSELEKLRSEQEQAANSGNDAGYTALIGKIAVLEAKAKRLESESVNQIDHHRYFEKLNDAYSGEIHKQIAAIEECAKKILDAGRAMENISFEYSAIISAACGLLDADKSVFINNGSDIMRFNRFLNKVIDPITENYNENSICGYCKGF